MSADAAIAESPEFRDAADLIALTGPAVAAADALLLRAREEVAARVSAQGRVSGRMLEAEQYAGHGLGWLATYVESLRQMHDWAGRLAGEGRMGEMECLLLQIAFGEYLGQIAGGIPMSQTEILRPGDMYLGAADVAAFRTGPVEELIASGNTDAARMRLVRLMTEREGAATVGDCGLDEEFEMVREQFRRFAVERVLPDAHDWHLEDRLVPMEIVEEMAELGVFGLTIPEEHGGLGMGKTAMCVVSEELSRGYIGVGSLGTRSEIAAELILCGGTDAQKAHYLPKLASGEILPTAVFTEPNTGSDLGALKTRAVRDGEDWVITGNKTWITHAARTDLMTVLARTVPDTDNYAGLSMFLAPKTRGDCETPFPDATLAGGEIEVLGYRGMKE